LVNGFECACVPGFKNKNCEVNINDCEPNPCLHGHCLDEVNNFRCECGTSGYNGTLCETNIDDCSVHGCMNNSTCRDLINDYECSCAPGFQGRFCETDINDCFPDNPCKNGGRCIDGINDFTCNCTPGYAGKSCNICPPSEADECNFSDGCCMEDIVFNSRTTNTNRTDIAHFRSKTEFFGLYKRARYDSTGRIVFQKKEDSAILKIIRYNIEEKRWIASAEAYGTNPKTHWESQIDSRCVSKSVETTPSIWTFDAGDGKSEQHEIEIICQSRIKRPNRKNSVDKSQNLCQSDQFTCISKSQCLPSAWRCDNIKDCEDASDECPRLNQDEENIYVKVVNDIKSKPELSVVGRFIIDVRAFSDESNTLKNITATAYKGETMIEQHSCEFSKDHHPHHCSE